MTALLYMLQPLARLAGRVRYGLAPWRRRCAPRLALPLPRTRSIWNERWQSADERLKRIEASLTGDGGAVLAGSDWDRWDLQVRGGLLGVARVRLAVEEHGSGRQMVRLRAWPKFSRIGLALALGLAALSALAAGADAWIACGALGALAVLLAITAVQDCAAAMGMILAAVAKEARSSEGGDVVEDSGHAPAEWVEPIPALDGGISENGHDSAAARRLREQPSTGVLRYGEIDGESDVAT